MSNIYTKLAALGAGMLAAVTFSTVSTPPVAEAAPIYIGSRVLFNAYDNVNRGGEAWNVLAANFGDCTRTGEYKIQLRKNTGMNPSIGGRISSFGKSTASPNCNYVIMYAYRWLTAKVVYCGEGYLPMNYVGDGCNDSFEYVRVMRR